MMMRRDGGTMIVYVFLKRHLRNRLGLYMRIGLRRQLNILEMIYMVMKDASYTKDEKDDSDYVCST